MFALVTTAFLLAGASSQVQSATPAASAAPAMTAPVVQEKKVCRRVQEIGSIMAKRTCRTQAEWEAIDRETGGNAQSHLEDMRSKHSY